MMYQSMLNFTEDSMKRECRNGCKLHGSNFCVALGTIAIGINGNEPILTNLQLKRNLEIAKKSGVQESIIFRLGGLEKNHVEFISKVLHSK